MNPLKQSRRAFLRWVTHPPVTPNADFFTASIGPVPHIEPDRWTLAIDGLVDTPLKLDRPTLHCRPAVQVMQTIACIGEHTPGPPLVGNAVWRGVTLWPLLAAAGIQANARRACFHAADGYSTAIDLWWLKRKHPYAAVLAYEMNGQALPAAHGAPLRLLVPGLYGQKMPKWITRIELIDHAYRGYWEQRGWSDVAAVRTHARFQSPAMYGRVGGPVRLRGVAYAGDQEITGVAVSVDRGPWQAATLAQPPSPRAWTGWLLDWRPNAPGVYSFRVRAADAMGTVQSEEPDSGRAFPAGMNTPDCLTLIVEDR